MNVTSTPRACVNTCTQCVHLTNPCTKQKVLSLTKLKGKIYKTKNNNIKKFPPQLHYIFSLSLLFLMSSSNPHRDASMQSSVLARSLPPSFLNTCSLPMSSFRCKDICSVINFLDIGFIYMSSSFVYFKKCPKCLTRGTIQRFIPLMRFILQSLVLRSFLIRLKYSFVFFFHLHLFEGICFQLSQVLVIFLFSNCFDSFLIRQFYSFHHVFSHSSL